MDHSRPTQYKFAWLACLALVSPLFSQEDDPCEGTPQAITLISATSGGAPGEGSSTFASINECGNWIVFQSNASNLHPEGSFSEHLYIQNGATGETSVILPDSVLKNPSISADGRYVSFESTDSDLVDNDANGIVDVFVYDRDTETVERVSVSSEGAEAWGFNATLSSDGSFVTFESNSQVLGNADFYSQFSREIFRYNLQTGDTTQVSVDEDGVDSNGNNEAVDISENGQWVAFASNATNLSFNDNNNEYDVYVKNLSSGAVLRASQRTGAEDPNLGFQQGSGRNPSISGDGRFVVYQSDSESLTTGVEVSEGVEFFDRNDATDIYIHDTQTRETSLLTLNKEGGATDGDSTHPSISSDGRYVVFRSKATNLVEGDTNGEEDIFVYDTLARVTKRANLNSESEQTSFVANGIIGLYSTDISSDGRYALFASNAINLSQEMVGNPQIYRAPNPFLSDPPVDPQDPSDFFTWSGKAGDGSWDTAGNWLDGLTNGPVNTAPGDPLEGGPEQTVIIENASVTLFANEISVGKIQATGELSVLQPLTIAMPSSIQSLSNQATILLNDDLSLSGESSVNLGSISGEGTLSIDPGASAVLSPLVLDQQEDQELYVSLVNNGTIEHPKNTSLRINADGELSTSSDGAYRVISGKITQALSEQTNDFRQDGYFEMNGEVDSDTFTLEAFTTSQGGNFNVVSGQLHLNNEATFSNTFFLTAPDTRLVFGEPIPLWDKGLGTVITGDVIASGDGLVEFKDNQFTIEEGKTAKFNLSLDQGGMEISEGAQILGEGTLENAGRMEISDAIIQAEVLNEGTLTIGGVNNLMNLKLEGGDFTNNQLVLQESSVVLGNVAVGEPTLISFIENHGTWTLFEGAEIFSESGHFNNRKDGTLKKEGPGSAEIKTFLRNDGNLFVSEGTLRLHENSTWGQNSGLGSGSVIINEGATLQLNTPEQALEIDIGDHNFFKDVEVTGGGHLEFYGDAIFLTNNSELTFSGTDFSVPIGYSRFVGGGISMPSGTFSLINPQSEPPTFIFKSTDINIGPRSKMELSGNSNIALLNNETTGHSSTYGPASKLTNEGEILIMEPYVREKDTLFFEGTGGMIENSGLIQVSTGSNAIIENDPVINKEARVYVDFEAVHAGKHGTVRVTDQSQISFEFLGPKTIEPLTTSTRRLKAGKWVIGYNSEILISSTITELGPYAKVTIIGDPQFIETPLAGKFGGLPNLNRDFVNWGDLRLNYATFTQSGSTFRNHRELTLTSARFEMKALGIDNGLLRNEITGRLKGTGEIVGGNVINKGIMSPGLSPGIITIEGDYIQEPEGVLEIELSGTGEAGTDFDQLIVDGTATLDGTLLIRELGNFNWSGSTSILALQATAINGSFEKILFSNSTSRRIASAAIENNMLEVTTSTLQPTTFDEWKTAHFDEAEQGDEAISGLTADPDGDRSSNLLEYAFDSVPNVLDVRNAGGEIQLNDNRDKYEVTFTFPWAKGMTDVEYKLQHSSDFGTWNDLESNVTNTVPSEFSDRLTVVGEIDANGDAPIYARLLVSVISE